MPLSALVGAGRGGTGSGAPAGAAAAAPAAGAPPGVAEASSGAETATDGPAARSPLLGEAARLEQAFAEALQARSAGAATDAIPALDRTILDWAADTLQTDEPDRARASSTRWCIGSARPRPSACAIPGEVVAPLVERLLVLRAELRTERPGSSPTASETA
jgi:hypothetical protein